MGINLKILICKIKANKYYNIMSYTVSKLNEEIKNDYFFLKMIIGFSGN